MPSSHPGRSWVAATLLGLLASLATPREAAAQASPTPQETRPRKSVPGKLERVDKRRNELVLLTDDGRRLAWRVEPDVIAEVEHFKLGEPTIMIYREMEANQKRLTAIAFPGTASAPVYVNLTGSRISIRTAPMVNGACAPPDASAVQERTVAAGGMTELAESCWCCAAAGETCAPATRTGSGRALIVRCFE